VWDVLKIEIRDHTILYCKNKYKLNRQERRSLEKELNAKLAKRDSKNVEDKNLNNMNYFFHLIQPTVPVPLLCAPFAFS
jgi:hypothetical protein